MVQRLMERRFDDLSVRVTRYAAGTVMPSHTHDTDGISVILEGELTEESGHREVLARAGAVVTKPAGVRHSNRFGPRGATLLSVELAPFGPHSPARWQWSECAPVARS